MVAAVLQLKATDDEAGVVAVGSIFVVLSQIRLLASLMTVASPAVQGRLQRTDANASNAFFQHAHSSGWGRRMMGRKPRLDAPRQP